MTTLENLLALQTILARLDEEEHAEALAEYYGNQTLQEEHTQTTAERVWG